MNESASKNSSEIRAFGSSQVGGPSALQKSSQSKRFPDRGIHMSHSELSNSKVASSGNSSVDPAVFDGIKPTEHLTGSILKDRYKIGEVLGEGAMAIVYDALDKQSGMKIAAKTLKYTEPSLSARFSREIEIHQRLKHPNIVEAIDCVQGEDNLCLFMMEKVDGKDLEECLEELYRFNNIEDFASILGQLCDGLEHAHKKGVIHRDLKPENIILKMEGNQIKLKILDFGVAKIQEDLQRLTKTGLVLGSPAYMSPEQCIGKKLSERSDIYAIGVLAFELLTGELPYQATDPVSMMKAHCSPEIFPKKIKDAREDVPAVDTLQSIINAMLQYDENMRYKDINQLKKDLDTWWQEANIDTSSHASPFTYTDISTTSPEAEEKPLKQDFSRLNELVESQRQTQVDNLRENLKEKEVPDEGIDKKSIVLYFFLGIVISVALVLTIVFLGLAQLK